jgi:D-hydroxyproline dehydrogenase subunit beta
MLTMIANLHFSVMRRFNLFILAIIGGGIVGLAHAYFALKRGFKVVLFEREEFAVGASVRNFGMIWPIGQQPGIGLEPALRARQHWIDISKAAGFWLNQNGSLHVAYEEDEWQVMNEFSDLYQNSNFDFSLLNANQTIEKSLVVKRSGLIGALWSATECIVNPREAIRRIPLWLQDQHGLQLRFGQLVREIAMPYIKTSTEIWLVDKAIVCSGADFETLYPEVYQKQPITKCKLQMMKAVTASNRSIGASLCAGLTLRHYAAFAACPSLKRLDKLFDEQNANFKKHGIHVLVSQNESGELIIGDSHHYNKTHEPFDSEEVNQIILNYLKTFTDFKDLKIIERWHGIYPKLQDNIRMVEQPEKNVTVVNGLGGAGMTLSFGIAEEVIAEL